MPTYEYVCEKCGHQFEKFQLMAARPLTSCPKELCAQKRWGKGRVKKVIGAGAGLIFKGSGFYITDYRSENYKQGAKKDSKDSTPATAATGGESGATKPAASGETKKPAAKSEVKPAKPAKPKD
jgi:putative FmdB family regulatory protein